MKKFFTNLSKCSAVVIMSFVGLLHTFSASAEEYKSMIRYDRVWECGNLEGSSKDEYVKCMRFDGTEEINGKTYHRIVTFKKTLWRYYGQYDESEDVYDIEGFMREENGVVYTLRSDGQEALIYDFNHKEGESYQGTTFVTDSPRTYQFNVISDHTAEIDGEECKVFQVAVSDSWGMGPTHTFIEGIGAAEYGCLNYHEFYDQPTGMWMRNVLSRVFDMDGNVIFRALSAGDRYDELEYGPFSGTNEVFTVAPQPKANDALYDMVGRRISKPVPGQLYIQDGKKHIAK